jgi:hypothetical protein
MAEQGLSEAIRQRLCETTLAEIVDADHWRRHLAALEIKDKRHVRIATKGALLGSLLEKGFNPELAIISDRAGQFAILLHGLCWIRAERLVHKLIPINDLQREAIANGRDQIWGFYADLKVYKVQPDTSQIMQFEDRFTAIFTQQPTSPRWIGYSADCISTRTNCFWSCADPIVHCIPMAAKPIVEITSRNVKSAAANVATWAGNAATLSPASRKPAGN